MMLEFIYPQPKPVAPTLAERIDKLQLFRFSMETVQGQIATMEAALSDPAHYYNIFNKRCEIKSEIECKKAVYARLVGMWNNHLKSLEI